MSLVRNRFAIAALAGPFIALAATPSQAAAQAMAQASPESSLFTDTGLAAHAALRASRSKPKGGKRAAPRNTLRRTRYTGMKVVRGSRAALRIYPVGTDLSGTNRLCLKDRMQLTIMGPRGKPRQTFGPGCDKPLPAGRGRNGTIVNPA